MLEQSNELKPVKYSLLVLMYSNPLTNLSNYTQIHNILRSGARFKTSEDVENLNKNEGHKGATERPDLCKSTAPEQLPAPALLSQNGGHRDANKGVRCCHDD